MENEKLYNTNLNNNNNNNRHKYSRKFRELRGKIKINIKSFLDKKQKLNNVIDNRELFYNYIINDIQEILNNVTEILNFTADPSDPTELPATQLDTPSPDTQDISPGNNNKFNEQQELIVIFWRTIIMYNNVKMSLADKTKMNILQESDFGLNINNTSYLKNRNINNNLLNKGFNINSSPKFFTYGELFLILFYKHFLKHNIIKKEESTRRNKTFLITKGNSKLDPSKLQNGQIDNDLVVFIKTEDILSLQYDTTFVPRSKSHVITHNILKKVLIETALDYKKISSIKQQKFLSTYSKNTSVKTMIPFIIVKRNLEGVSVNNNTSLSTLQIKVVHKDILGNKLSLEFNLDNKLAFPSVLFRKNVNGNNKIISSVGTLCRTNNSKSAVKSELESSWAQNLNLKCSKNEGTGATYYNIQNKNIQTRSKYTKNALKGVPISSITKKAINILDKNNQLKLEFDDIHNLFNSKRMGDYLQVETVKEINKDENLLVSLNKQAFIDFCKEIGVAIPSSNIPSSNILSQKRKRENGNGDNMQVNKGNSMINTFHKEVIGKLQSVIQNNTQFNQGKFYNRAIFWSQDRPACFFALLNATPFVYTQNIKNTFFKSKLEVGNANTQTTNFVNKIKELLNEPEIHFPGNYGDAISIVKLILGEDSEDSETLNLKNCIKRLSIIDTLHDFGKKDSFFLKNVIKPWLEGVKKVMKNSEPFMVNLCDKIIELIKTRTNSSKAKYPISTFVMNIENLLGAILRHKYITTRYIKEHELDIKSNCCIIHDSGVLTTVYKNQLAETASRIFDPAGYTFELVNK